MRTTKKTNIEDKIEFIGFIKIFIGIILITGEIENVSLVEFIKIKAVCLGVFIAGILLVRIAHIIRKEKNEQNRGLYYLLGRKGGIRGKWHWLVKEKHIEELEQF